MVQVLVNEASDFVALIMLLKLARMAHQVRGYLNFCESSQ